MRRTVKDGGVVGIVEASLWGDYAWHEDAR